MKKLSLISICACLLAGCAMGPDFLKPQTAADEQGSFINEVYSDKQPRYSMSRWWERINDPLLNHYVDQLLEQNLALKEAGERIVQARARVTSERGNYFPSIGQDATASRSFAKNALTDDRTFTNAYNASLDASWQIDLFGKISKNVDSAKAGFEASVYDREALVHALISELLNRRVAIAVNKDLLDLARQNAQNRKDTYELVQRRYDLGARGTTLAEVYLAEENYTSVMADIHQFERLLAEESYRLDVLLGLAPGSTDPLAEPFPILPPPLDVPVCLPADLLDRRPDLKASELRVKAATADIGVAIADLYPSLTLGGNIGFSDVATGGLFTAENLAGSILANITTRIFEGGSLRANIKIQESEARELSAAYAGDVLEAMREVETALKSEHELAGELENVQRSADALQSAEEISQERYMRGIQTLQDFLDTQQRRYASDQALLRKQQEKWNARISLYMALGGDWLDNWPDKDHMIATTCEKRETL